MAIEGKTKTNKPCITETLLLKNKLQIIDNNTKTNQP